MSVQDIGKVHMSFWIIAGVTLLWNLMGIFNLSVQLDPNAVASMEESHRAVIEGRPLFASFGFGLGVYGGALGCLALFMRQKFASTLFIASFIGVILTVIHSVSIALTAVLDPFEVTMWIIMTTGIAGFLIWYAKYATAKGWLR